MAKHLALIVEDDPGLRLIYQRVLEKEDYRIIEAANGADAIDFLRHDTPNLIFLDMLLPLVNGERVIEFLNSEHRFDQTCVIIVSSNQQLADFAKHLSWATFVVKPILPSQIRRFAQIAAQRLPIE